MCWEMIIQPKILTSRVNMQRAGMRSLSCINILDYGRVTSHELRIPSNKSFDLICTVWLKKIEHEIHFSQLGRIYDPN